MCEGANGYLHPSIHPDFNTTVWFNIGRAQTPAEAICNFGAANLTNSTNSYHSGFQRFCPCALSSDPSDQLDELDDAGRCWPVRPSPPTNPPTTSQPTATPAPTTQFLARTINARTTTEPATAVTTSVATSVVTSDSTVTSNDGTRSNGGGDNDNGDGDRVDTDGNPNGALVDLATTALSDQSAPEDSDDSVAGGCVDGCVYAIAGALVSGSLVWRGSALLRLLFHLAGRPRALSTCHGVLSTGIHVSHHAHTHTHHLLLFLTGGGGAPDRHRRLGSWPPRQGVFDRCLSVTDDGTATATSMSSSSLHFISWPLCHPSTRHVACAA